MSRRRRAFSLKVDYQVLPKVRNQESLSRFTRDVSVYQYMYVYMYL